jgi:hypothetical protein
MMALGEAAGVASALALEQPCHYPDVSVARIRDTLSIPAFIEKVVRDWQLQ